MGGRATLTTVESRNTMPDPSTAATRIQRRRSPIGPLLSLRSWPIVEPASRPPHAQLARASRPDDGGFFHSDRDVFQPDASPALAEMRLDLQIPVGHIKAKRSAKPQQGRAGRPGLRSRGGRILDGLPRLFPRKAGKELGQPGLESLRR